MPRRCMASCENAGGICPSFVPRLDSKAELSKALGSKSVLMAPFDVSRPNYGILACSLMALSLNLLLSQQQFPEEGIVILHSLSVPNCTIIKAGPTLVQSST